MYVNKFGPDLMKRPNLVKCDAAQSFFFVALVEVSLIIRKRKEKRKKEKRGRKRKQDYESGETMIFFNEYGRFY